MEEISEIRFLNKLGLKANPFQYTNADQEDLLESYFVPPPYFQSIWGTPDKPASCIVFAPRGAGKSAQRRMVEFRSKESGDVLTIEYSRFEFNNGTDLSKIDLQYHLTNIIRLILFSILLNIYEREMNHMYLESTDKRYLMELSRFYLTSLSPEEVKRSIQSIKSPFEKGIDFLNKRFWAVSAIISIVLHKLQMGPIALDRPGQLPNINSVSKNHLDLLAQVLLRLGYKCIYILIDKVDETELTGNDPEASFLLIRSMLRDLELLQQPHIGFKFFLWNEVSPHYKKFSRADRVQQYELNWQREELRKMMQLRLQTFKLNSDDTLAFSDLLHGEMSNEEKQAVESLLLAFAHGSPRDMIRIARQMISEQLRLNPYHGKITREAVKAAFNTFCEDRAKEILPPKILDELKKNKKLDFTTSHLVSTTFKIDANSARVKIKSWIDTGVVKNIDTIMAGKNKKPVHHFAVVDARVAKAIFPELEFVEFLKKKVWMCNNCGIYLLRDWNEAKRHICHLCKNPINANADELDAAATR